MNGKITIEIPKTCRECRLFLQSYGYLCVGEEFCTDEHTEWLKRNYAGERPVWCPIKEDNEDFDYE